VIPDRLLTKATRAADTLGVAKTVSAGGKRTQTLASWITTASDQGRVWFGAAALLAVGSGRRGRRAAAEGLAAAGAGSLVVNAVVKPLVRRRRPTLPAPLQPALGRAPRTSSFPSSHTTTAFAFATAAGAALPAAAPVLGVAAAAVGWARVRGRRHFPTDVVAGALLGAAVGAAVHAAAPGADGRPTRLAAG
jgi:undecaprenyl-diphosphatase